MRRAGAQDRYTFLLGADDDLDNKLALFVDPIFHDVECASGLGKRETVSDHLLDAIESTGREEREGCWVAIGIST